MIEQPVTAGDADVMAENPRIAAVIKEQIWKLPGVISRDLPEAK
jgi:hypothetical protein